MAGTPAVHSGLLLSLTAELEKVARLCCLPSGWTCHPSLRLTPKGASLLVHWSPSPAAETKRAKGGKTKRRRRSAASQKRSAERAVLHKARQGPTASGQPLNPAAAPFTQTPTPSAPNSVPAAGQPAAVDSERVEGRIEVLQKKKARTEESLRQVLAPQPGPASDPVQRWPASIKAWQHEVDTSGQMIVDAWERGERDGPLFLAECRTLDSLAGQGYARGLLRECELRARRPDGG